MLEWIWIGFLIFLGFYLAPMVVSIVVAIFVGIYVVLNEILKSIVDLFRSKE